MIVTVVGICMRNPEADHYKDNLTEVNIHVVLSYGWPALARVCGDHCLQVRYPRAHVHKHLDVELYDILGGKMKWPPWKYLQCNPRTFSVTFFCVRWLAIF